MQPRKTVTLRPARPAVRITVPAPGTAATPSGMPPNPKRLKDWVPLRRVRPRSNQTPPQRASAARSNAGYNSRVIARPLPLQTKRPSLLLQGTHSLGSSPGWLSPACDSERRAFEFLASWPCAAGSPWCHLKPRARSASKPAPDARNVPFHRASAPSLRLKVANFTQVCVRRPLA